MHVVVQQLNKRFGSYEATKDVSFSIAQGQLIGLLGPSGGGKTTILRMLAGLEVPDSGEIRFHGAPVNHLPPQERQIGFVFQNYALFRHMTVFENIAFGLKIKKKGKTEIREKVSALIELTGLKGLEQRFPNQLSGGQRQRVAFARALALEPQLLLLDEPFAAIDAKVRKELRTWLKEMIGRVGITTIFVTHDQEEAVEVADEIMIINRGRLEQKGTPIEIYKNPATPFVASFIGESNTLDDYSYLKGFEEEAGRSEGESGGKAIIRPEAIEIGREQEISFPFAAEQGVVKNVFFRGSSWQVEVEIGPYRLFGYRSPEKEPLQPGDRVLVLIHELHRFTGHKTQRMGNGLKFDPMPVHT